MPAGGYRQIVLWTVSIPPPQDTLAETADGFADDLTVYYFTSRSMDDALAESVSGEALLFVITCKLAFGRCKKRHRFFPVRFLGGWRTDYSRKLFVPRQRKRWTPNKHKHTYIRSPVIDDAKESAGFQRSTNIHYVHP